VATTYTKAANSGEVVITRYRIPIATEKVARYVGAPVIATGKLARYFSSSLLPTSGCCKMPKFYLADGLHPDVSNLCKYFNFTKFQ